MFCSQRYQPDPCVRVADVPLRPGAVAVNRHLLGPELRDKLGIKGLPRLVGDRVRQPSRIHTHEGVGPEDS